MPKLRQQKPKPVLYPGVTLSNSILYCNRGEWVSHFSLSLSLILFLCLTLQYLTEEFLPARPFTCDALYFTQRNT